MHFTVSRASPSIVFLEHVVLIASLSIEGISRRYELSDYVYFIKYEATDVASLENWLQDPHPRRGDIMIELISPQGTSSTLLPYRRYDFINYDDGQCVYNLWPFMSVHYWGENPVGDWTMIVTFKSTSGTVRVSDVELTLYGTTDIPQAVVSIPSTCNDKCARGCYGNGPNFCDVCQDFRIVSTLECVTTCPNNTVEYKDSYCVGSSTDTSKNNIKYIAIGTSVGGILLLGLIACIVVSCILIYVCRKKNGYNNQLQYRVLGSEDSTASVPV